MPESNNSLLRTILWTILWALVCCSYGYTTLFGCNLINKVYTNEQTNRKEHQQIVDCIYQHILPMAKDIASLQTDTASIKKALKI